MARTLVSASEWRPALEELVHTFLISRALICAVCEIPPALEDMLAGAGVKAQMLTACTRVPVINDYRSPRTLGADRLAAVCGAKMLLPGENVLVVDVGSCVTYDVLLRDGHYLGGNIAPGLKMRLLSMHEHTARLPLVDKEGPTPLIGFDTPTAMRSGAIRGITYEIRALGRDLRREYGKMRLLLTGGDAGLVKQMSGLRVRTDDLLVLRGLDYIIRYNEQFS